MNALKKALTSRIAYTPALDVKKREGHPTNK
jgi:hypothetical protein